MINDTVRTGAYPPLTPDDIYILRGKPAAKNVMAAGSKTRTREEWIYYHADAKTRESYVFRGNRLVGWTKSGANGRGGKIIMLKQMMLLFALVFFVFPVRMVFACMAHYYSPDNLVAESPLILIGKVENVKEIYLPEEEGELVLWEDESDDHGLSAEATVKIIAILKGNYTEPTIRIGSGPIESCSPSDVHYTFIEEEISVFILPEAPLDGYATLRFGGTKYPLDKINIVMSRIDRANLYKGTYLADMSKNFPGIYRSAQEFSKQMQKLSSKWPEQPDEGDPAFKEKNNLFKAAQEELIKELSMFEIETIRTALALNWLDYNPSLWCNKGFWRFIRWDFSDNRKKDIAIANNALIKRKLEQLGMEKKYINEYLTALKDNNDRLEYLTFPPSYSANFRKGSSDVMTTQFILEFNSFDQGGMYRVYGRFFVALADLNPERLQFVIPAMLASDDENLSLVAYRAIQRISGNAFVPLILNRMLNYEYGEWNALVNNDNKEETEKRLTELIKFAEQNLDAYEYNEFWNILRIGDCFERVCLDTAIEKLRSVEKAPVRDADAIMLQGTLQKYLSEAIDKQNKPYYELSADEYQEKLKPQPEPPKEDEYEASEKELASAVKLKAEEMVAKARSQIGPRKEGETEQECDTRNRAAMGMLWDAKWVMRTVPDFKIEDDLKIAQKYLLQSHYEGSVFDKNQMPALIVFMELRDKRLFVSGGYTQYTDNVGTATIGFVGERTAIIDTETEKIIDSLDFVIFDIDQTGNRIVGVKDNHIIVTDIKSKKILFEKQFNPDPNDEKYYFVQPAGAITGDGKQVVVSLYEGGCARYDVDTGKQLKIYSKEELPPINSILMNSTGKNIVAGTVLNYMRTSLMLRSGKRSIELGYRMDGRTSMAFSPDDKYLAASAMGGAVFYLEDINKNNKRLEELNRRLDPLIPEERGSEEIVAIAFSPDGKWLVTVDQASREPWDLGVRNTLVRVFNVSSWSLYACYDVGPLATSICWQEDSKKAYVGHANGDISELLIIKKR